ncbi:hypothetical protein FA95DRAFT_1610402 [Auriscalpium vulgare]|uniref:Uncharacterized protein n=1 Tax=Auriscalpium vulgare TaxID=40419 RepID=A0ACB8RE61_9AGAM|nr:hypothetical protein FA95DRAFT_1610402 [Auriscalpium vulgare]
MQPVLPHDIFVFIIDSVYLVSQSEVVDYATLSAISLTCRAFTAPAQRLIFRRIPAFVASKESCFHRIQPETILAVITANPHLGTYVRTLCVFIGAGHPDDVDLALLARCPALASVNISAYNPQLFQGDMEARLREAASPRVLCVGGTNTCIFALLDAWPGLRFLDAVGSNRHDQTLHPIVLPEGIKITWYDRSNTHANLAWLLAPVNNFAALHTLVLQVARWDQPECVALFAAAPLQAVRTVVFQGRFPPACVFRGFASLEDLFVAELPSDGIILPRTLKHVGYHKSADIAQSAVRMDAFVAALGALPALDSVSVTRQVSAEALQTLEQTCRRAAVDFLVYASADSYPHWWNVDWIW